jgi:L-ascorbate metabolism protein UlaG (beta-lactamase superfamily)
MSGFACDIALLPVSGTYVMTVEEAVEAAQTLQPRIAIPMHYGAGIGTGHDGQRFAALYPGKTALLTPK